MPRQPVKIQTHRRRINWHRKGVVTTGRPCVPRVAGLGAQLVVHPDEIEIETHNQEP